MMPVALPGAYHQMASAEDRWHLTLICNCLDQCGFRYSLRREYFFLERESILLCELSQLTVKRLNGRVSLYP
jgi:hypothetical protein